MGVFDNTSNRKYNDAQANYDIDDGVDIVTCDSDCKECRFKDTKLNRCVFETCIKNQFPYSVPFHTTHTKKCIFCNEEYTVEYGENDHPLLTEPVNMCESCRAKLSNLIIGESDE